MKLTIELVPKTCWYSNVRSHILKTDWDKLRKECYRLAKHKCEICGGKGKKWPVECHEVWHYNDIRKIQKLQRLIALCPSCHEVKHAGRSQKLGLYDKVLNHLSKVNNITKREAIHHIETSLETWSQRSQYSWTLDISYLTDQGIKINETHLK